MTNAAVPMRQWWRRLGYGLIGLAIAFSPTATISMRAFAAFTTYLVRSVTPGLFLWPGATAQLQCAPEEFGRTTAATIAVK